MTTITSGLADLADTSTGSRLLDDVDTFTARFIAYPSDHARTAHVLWIAHCHLMDCFESTPRLAALSPEPGSGKSRLLEVTEPLVPRPVHAVNTTPAYLFRKVSDAAGLPTILYDEIDTVFGPRAKDNEDIRGMLNAGHRRGATAGRCVVHGKTVETEELPAYCAVALAGLNDLPDTIMTRAVVIRMRRRSPAEKVEPWRHRINAPQAEELMWRLEAWADEVRDDLTDSWPDMPAEIQDRDADVWEPLLTVADAAGGQWPDLARLAALALVREGKEQTPSLNVQLLADSQKLFEKLEKDQLPTTDLVKELVSLPESPWADLRGKELDARSLARRLAAYGIKPAQIWIDGVNIRGYRAADFRDAWDRYLEPEASARSARPLEGTSGQDMESSGTQTVTAVTEPATSGPFLSVSPTVDAWFAAAEERDRLHPPSEASADPDYCTCGRDFLPDGTCPVCVPAVVS